MGRSSTRRGGCKLRIEAHGLAGRLRPARVGLRMGGEADGGERVGVDCNHFLPMAGVGPAQLNDATINISMDA